MAAGPACAAIGDAGNRVCQRRIADGYAPGAAAFRQGLKEAGYVEGQSVAMEFRWAKGHDDSLPATIADLVRDA